jgi:hypothetical protein
MKKHIAIHLLGGNMARVAEHLGTTKQSPQKWPVDEQGNITSRRVVDSVLAALVRINYARREAGLNEPLPIDEATLQDLLAAPPELSTNSARD